MGAVQLRLVLLYWVARIQQLMLSNTLVKLLSVFLFATPAVLVGGELYSLLQPDTSLWDGFLKIYSVLYIIPGGLARCAARRSVLCWLRPELC